MKNHLVLFTCVAMAAIILAVDPLAYSSFTAPKHHLLILMPPLLILLTLWKTKRWMLGLISVLFFLRILWLAAANPEWVTHPGDDGFYLQVSLLLLLLAGRQLQRKDYTRYVFPPLFFLGIIETMIGIWQLSIHIPDPAAPMKTAMIGTLGTSNGLGLLLVISFIAGIILLKQTSQKWSRMGISVGLIVILSGVGLSESRGAVLALLTAVAAVGLLVLYASEKPFSVWIKKYSEWVASGTVLLFILVIFGLYSLDRESSLGRVMVWEITREMIREKPFMGLGQGNYAMEYLNYQTEFLSDSAHAHLHPKAANLKQAHNEFLQAFAEGGMPGGVLFLLIWIVPLFYGVRKLVRSKSMQWERAGAIGIHIAIITHSMVDSPLHVLPIAVIGYLNMAIIPVQGPGLLLSPLKRASMIIILVLYSGFAAYRSIRLYPAHHDWKKGAELAEQNKWKPAVLHYQHALEQFGKKGELEHHLGSALVFDGQYSRGIYYLNKAKKDFNDRNIYLAESYANIQLQNYETAEGLAKQGLNMFPDQLAPHLLLGEIYYKLGESELSKVSLMKCIRLETAIISPETKQISQDAKVFWRNKYGQLPLK